MNLTCRACRTRSSRSRPSATRSSPERGSSTASRTTSASIGSTPGRCPASTSTARERAGGSPSSSSSAPTRNTRLKPFQPSSNRSNLRRVPDLSHLWQRFLLAIALLFGLVLGVGATVFGYSTTAPVAIGFSVFRIDGVPLWTVALVPLALVLVTGTVFHWLNGLHHFTEHMRHRRRVHELEAEVTSLRAHLDGLLEMPDHTATKQPPETISAETASN